MPMRVPSDPVEAYRVGETIGRVVTYCEQVQAGAKLVGEFGVLRQDTVAVREAVEREGCHVRFVERGSDERVTAEVFSQEWVAVLLDEMSQGQRDDPPSALDVFMSGKLFGYSDHEIASFLRRRGYIRELIRSAS